MTNENVEPSILREVAIGIGAVILVVLGLVFFLAWYEADQ